MTRKGHSLPAVLVLEYATIKSIIEAIPKPVDQMFAACLYGNGARIGEICRLTYQDFEFTDEFVYVHSQVLKKRGKEIQRRKNPIDLHLEPWLANIIRAYVQKKKLGLEDNRRVWRWSHRTARRHIQKYFGQRSHALRHIRVTHLIVFFQYNMRDLMEYFVLSDKGLASWVKTYGHLERSYLEDKFRKLRVKPTG